MIVGGNEKRVDVEGLDDWEKGKKGASFKTSFSRDDTARETYMLSEFRRPKLIDW